MIYLPEDNVYNKCYVVQSEGVIRGYEETPTYNNSISYRDYYIKSDYIYRDGSQTFNQYSTLPTCLDIDLITSRPFYRIDFDKICIIFLTFLIVIIMLIKPIAKKFFKGGF